jgi:hypothetical protein
MCNIDRGGIPAAQNWSPPTLHEVVFRNFYSDRNLDRSQESTERFIRDAREIGRHCFILDLWRLPFRADAGIVKIVAHQVKQKNIERPARMISPLKLRDHNTFARSHFALTPRSRRANVSLA